MKLFGIIGIPELIIIVVIICVLFGPALFKKINKQVKATGKAARKGIENGTKAAGADVDLDNIDKDAVLDKIEGLQNHVDKMFNSDEDDADEAPAASTSDSSAKDDDE